MGKALIEARVAGEEAIVERFERARAEGDLPADVDVKQLAGFIRTVVYGMTVKAASGATRDELEGVIELALSAWPRRERA